MRAWLLQTNREPLAWHANGEPPLWVFFSHKCKKVNHIPPEIADPILIFSWIGVFLRGNNGCDRSYNAEQHMDYSVCETQAQVGCNQPSPPVSINLSVSAGEQMSEKTGRPWCCIVIDDESPATVNVCLGV